MHEFGYSYVHVNVVCVIALCIVKSYVHFQLGPLSDTCAYSFLSCCSLTDALIIFDIQGEGVYVGQVKENEVVEHFSVEAVCLFVWSF